MRVLLDTNIIMDALQERQPFDMDAKEILKRSQRKVDVLCLFTANAATDIFYLYSKARDVRSAKAALEFLLNAYEVVAVTHDDCVAALSSAIEDFEDALVTVCAQKAGADYIVTRDEELLHANSPVKAIAPGAFVKVLRGGSKA